MSFDASPTIGFAPAGTGKPVAATIILAVGALLWAAGRFVPASLPAWMPWDFSILWYLGFAFSGWWYVRGLRRAPQPAWRRGFFAAGMILLWIVLQTRFDYLAQHMFFFNRTQHVVMHHLGPFLIVLAWPWATVREGMPAPVRGLFDGDAFRSLLHLARQPLLAPAVFVGLVALWLVPTVHFAAMIDPALYQLMNWSMVLDGLLFWAVVLDPRPKREAGNSFTVRAAMGIGVMFPQIVIGALIAFAQTDLYRFYAWCGRIYASIGPLEDQQLGGLIIWIPPAMMSALSLLLVLNAMRMVDEARAGG